jgi:glycerol kinase
MAGLGSGYWSSPEEAFSGLQVEKVFEPEIDAAKRGQLYQEWTKAVHHAMGWLKK